MIDTRAIIDPRAVLAQDITVGPWTVIGPDVEIDSGTEIGSHVVVKGPTRIGCNNKIFQFASVGEAPQDKKYRGEPTWLEIGDHNTIREFCTLNRGTVQAAGATTIGNGNLLMAYTHIAHDCIIGNHTVFANYTALAGHVVVEDHAILSAYSAVHQYCRIGCYSFIAAGALIRQDVTPYVLVKGRTAKICGLNIEGLRRHGFSNETVSLLRHAYKTIFRAGLTAAQAIKELTPLLATSPEVASMVSSIQRSTRGIVR